MEGLDAKIIRVLYAYYEGHRGEPKMPFADLLEQFEYDDFDLVHEKIGTLKTTEFLDGNFLEGGQAGLIWLTPDGISTAKQLPPEAPQEASASSTEADSPPQTAFVSNCRYDVFVSYALPEGEAEQWQVTQTVEKLREKITNSFQAHGQTLVWGENTECGPAIVPELYGSALRILIVSERYSRQSAALAEPDALFARPQHIKQGRQTVVLELDEAAQSFGASAQALRYALWESPNMIAYHNLLSDIAMQVCVMLQDLREKSKVLAQVGAENRGKTVFIDHDEVDASLAESVSGKIENELHPTIFFPDSSDASPSE
ncbi:MAG: hypothetical protein GY794_14490, partial [bacterium]|nr:hypothetical protein [bacterium]